MGAGRGLTCAAADSACQNAHCARKFMRALLQSFSVGQTYRHWSIGLSLPPRGNDYRDAASAVRPREIRLHLGVPELSRFFGIIIRMFVEAGGKHHVAHFHA